MKQFIFCTHYLKIKSAVMTEKTVRVFDCVTPQKTAIEIPLNYDIENNDIVIIRDHATSNTEYIGIIDTVAHERTTTILLYPFESILDNECILSSLDGDVYTWVVNSITRNFIGTGDALNDYPIIFEDHTGGVNYKRIIESQNLIDNLNDIFLNTGIYVKFGIAYNAEGHPVSIIADVRNANTEDAIYIRYDNPIIIDNKVLIESSHTGNYNKAIIRVPYVVNGIDDGDYMNLYLREDNKLTTDPADPHRIKQVKPKIIDYKPSDDEITVNQQGEAVILLAQKALCGNSYDHSIEFDVVINDGYDWRVNKRCDFTSKDRVFETFVTGVEYLSDRHARIKLGAYRYTMTDRFKALRRDDVKADSIKGVSVSSLFENSMFWFSQDENGVLYLNYPDTIVAPKFTIEEVNGEKCLMFEYDTAHKYAIDSNGELVYNV